MESRLPVALRVQSRDVHKDIDCTQLQQKSLLVEKDSTQQCNCRQDEQTCGVKRNFLVLLDLTKSFRKETLLEFQGCSIEARLFMDLLIQSHVRFTIVTPHASDLDALVSDMGRINACHER